jgi:hypothetical protein
MQIPNKCRKSQQANLNKKYVGWHWGWLKLPWKDDDMYNIIDNETMARKMKIVMGGGGTSNIVN